jgi:hypothetical protein
MRTGTGNHPHPKRPIPPAKRVHTEASSSDGDYAAGFRVGGFFAIQIDIDD